MQNYDASALRYNNNEPVNLTNCDKEPIHIIGSVQDQGFLIVLDNNSNISNSSTNVERFLGYSWKDLIGKPIQHVFPSFNDNHDTLRDFGASEMYQFKETMTDAQKADGSMESFHVCCHINSDNLIIIEAEPLIEENFAQDYSERIANLFKIFSETQDLYAVLDLVAGEVKEVGGYSRVMIYEFDREYQGRVIIEKTEMESRFLGLHFPSTDIPVQARRLFVKNRFRLLEDVNTVPSLVLPQNRHIDQTYCLLRSSSPIHIQYLNNMGVRGSLTISIVIGREKRLWGMIVSHNYHHRKNITFAQRKYCDMLGKVLSIQVENILQRREMAQRINLESKLSVVRDQLADVDITNNSWEDSICPLLPNLAELLECDGALLNIKGKTYKFGQVGSASEQIRQWIMNNKRKDRYFVTESTVHDLGIECEDGFSCGILWMQLLDKEVSLSFYRNELIRSINWAGEPKKIDVSGVLNPRASFAQWKEIKKGRCIPWSPEQTDYALQIQAILTRFIFRWSAEKFRVDAERDREVKEKLLREQEVIKQSAMLHNNFLATVSHELRTPIHSILGNTERLLDFLGNEPDAQQACKMITSSSEHLLAIISDILDLTKLESNKLEITASAFDFYKKMESITDSFFSLAANKGLYVVALLPVGIPAIEADPIRLGQVILNFMSNAVKFTQIGGITLRVDLISRSEQQVELEFRVIDTGPGISEPDRIKLFERFFQLEGGRSRKFDGSGLGLAISKQLIHLMGGEVGVDSREGEGSTFWARVKLQLTATQAHQRPYESLPGYTEDSYIVVFEKRPFVRTFLTHQIKQWKCKVLYFLDLTPAHVIDCIQNYKTLKAVIIELNSTNSQQVQQALSMFKQSMPSLAMIVVDAIPASRFEGECDGVLRHPLNVIRLHELLTKSAPKKSIAPGARSGGEQRRKLRILLAEDNKSNQHIATSFLKSLNHEVDVVENGILAVRAVQSKFYDVVLMDIMMPVMDGITATVQIRSYEKLTGKHIIIMALTAVSESTLVDECLKSGMDMCLFKPFKKLELEKALITAEKLMLTPPASSPTPME